MTFSPLIIWAKALFFFEQLFLVVARTWLELKSVCLFLGPKKFWPKNSILVNGPFVALRVTVHFPPWERFFDFPFRSYSCFRKKILLTAQKVFPLPTVGFYCTVKALALSARGLDKGGSQKLLSGLFPLILLKLLWVTFCMRTSARSA